MAKTNPPKHNDKDKRDMVRSWEFEQRVVLPSQHQSKIRFSWKFCQTKVFICANSNFSPKTVTFDFHELIEFIDERFGSGCAKSANPSPEYHLQIVTGFGKFRFQHFPTGSEICPIFGTVP